GGGRGSRRGTIRRLDPGAGVERDRPRPRAPARATPGLETRSGAPRPARPGGARVTPRADVERPGRDARIGPLGPAIRSRGARGLDSGARLARARGDRLRARLRDFDALRLRSDLDPR